MDGNFTQKGRWRGDCHWIMGAPKVKTRALSLGSLSLIQRSHWMKVHVPKVDAYQLLRKQDPLQKRKGTEKRHARHRKWIDACPVSKWKVCPKADAKSPCLEKPDALHLLLPVAAAARFGSLLAQSANFPACLLPACLPVAASASASASHSHSHFHSHYNYQNLIKSFSFYHFAVPNCEWLIYFFFYCTFNSYFSQFSFTHFTILTELLHITFTNVSALFLFSFFHFNFICSLYLGAFCTSIFANVSSSFLFSFPDFDFLYSLWESLQGSSFSSFRNQESLWVLCSR